MHTFIIILYLIYYLHIYIYIYVYICRGTLMTTYIYKSIKKLYKKILVMNRTCTKILKGSIML